MIHKSKVATYIGFAIRSNKCKMGVNAIMTLKRANLILICKSASENTVKQVEKIARGFHCEVLKTKNKLLEEFTFRPNNKAMAITDKSLADAIKKDFSEDFIL